MLSTFATGGERIDKKSVQLELHLWAPVRVLMAGKDMRSMRVPRDPASLCRRRCGAWSAAARKLAREAVPTVSCLPLQPCSG